MDLKDKVFHLNSLFTKDAPPEGDIENIYISGYASVNSPDRVGDVVPTSVWEKGMQNYLKNPVILAHHDHSSPVGRMVDHKIDQSGLWIKARVSSAAEDVYGLVKDGVLTAFSVSFRILDAEYKSEIDLFVIKELELIEISVVSVPCNPDTLFSLSKSFSNDEEYLLFKTQFVTDSNSTKGLNAEETNVNLTLKELGMDSQELKDLLDNTAKSAAELAAKAILDAQKAEKDAVAKAAADEAAMQDRIKKALEAVTPSTTGAEKLLDEVQKRFEEATEANKKALEGLEATLKEKSAELEALQKSKMIFKDNNTDGPSYEDKEKAILISKITNKNLESTKFGRELVEKYGAHVNSATWELEVSLNMENEIRRKLVVAPILRSIQMKTNVMTFPLNPEAGLAQWMANSAFGTTTSAGNTATHTLGAVTLSAFKVATTEYVAYEEDEDALFAVMPIVRDAMIRRLARSLDRAFLYGAGSGADPVKGLCSYDATSAVNVTTSGAVTVANMRSLRKDLGAWGLDPVDVMYIVSTDVYYDLLDDTIFQTMDKVGPKATLLTGQIGVIGNSPVLVSAEFPAKTGSSSSAVTNYAALAVTPGNFLAGNQRGVRVDSQDLVEKQSKVLVASLRTGMTQLTTNLGQGVSVLRWS